MLSSSSLPSPTPSSFSYSLIQCYCIRRLSTAWRQMCLMAPNVLSCFWNEIKFPFFKSQTKNRFTYMWTCLRMYLCGFSNAGFFLGGWEPFTLTGYDLFTPFDSVMLFVSVFSCYVPLKGSAFLFSLTPQISWFVQKDNMFVLSRWARLSMCEWKWWLFAWNFACVMSKRSLFWLVNPQFHNLSKWKLQFLSLIRIRQEWVNWNCPTTTACVFFFSPATIKDLNRNLCL